MNLTIKAAAKVAEQLNQSNENCATKRKTFNTQKVGQGSP
jgi:hypothetical protein